MSKKLIGGIIGLMIFSWFIGFAMGAVGASLPDEPREIIREVEVPGPERIVEVEVPGPEVIVEVPVEVIREVEVPVQVIVEVPAIVRENDLVVRGETVSIASWFGQEWFTVQGEVFNNSSAIAYSVKVVGTFYDIDGNVVCVDNTVTLSDDINPGDSSPFIVDNVSCLNENPPSIISFKIVALV